MENTAVGMVSYDVPVSRREAYSKISSKLRGNAIMQTYSCYLIPWDKKDVIANIFNNLNAEDKIPINYQIVKFDNSSADVINKMVEQGIVKILQHAKEMLYKRIAAVREEIENGKMEEDMLPEVAKASIKQMKKALKEASAAALNFDAEANMHDALVSYQKIIESEAKFYLTKEVANGAS